MAKIEISINPEIKKDIDKYRGEAVTLTYIITDVNGDNYQSDIDLLENWTPKILSEAMTATFMMCAAMPKKVYISRIGKNLELMN